MSSRREFLRRMAAAGTFAAIGGVPVRAAGRLGKIGIQLYTVRRELAKDVEGTLARLAEIGFTEVEFAGFPAGTAASLRGILDRHHLTAPSGHVGIGATRQDWDRTLDDAATVGQRYIVVASIGQEERKTADDWKRICARFNTAGEAARARGLTFAYHNHDFEFSPIDGTLPYEILLREADAKLVQMELDLYWATKGGQDPAAYFEQWPGRFPLVHVKDMDATPRRYFTEVGKGTIDFPRIFRAAKRGGVRHYFYEQDEVPASPFDSAKTSFQYLRALTF